MNYARHVISLEVLSLALEIPFVANPDEDLHLHTSPVSASYRSYFVTPAARLNLFSNQGVSPWISAGGGFAYFSKHFTPGFSTAGNSTGVLQIGGGLDVRLIRRFTLRGEVRDFWSGVPQSNVITDTSRTTQSLCRRRRRLALLNGNLGEGG